MLHSTWALATGIVVLVLARERYHLVPWVVLFLAITWVSTLIFGRAAAAAEPGQAPGLVWEVASYVTRVLYQETLFFLLPFYAYSTVLGSPNVLFLVLLGGLAVLSCVDLLFDRWLRTRPLFALGFFAVVAFAALNLLLPLIAGVRPRFAAPVAALLAIGGAALLARRTVGGRGRTRWLVPAGAVVMLGAILLFPQVIPPVPLRLERATFASALDQNTLVPRRALGPRVSAAEAGRALYVVFEVFSPTAVPATVQLEWLRDGRVLRTSRDVAITAHAGGFRLWDAWHPSSGAVPAGRYRVVVETSGRRVFGVARLVVRQ